MAIYNPASGVSPGQLDAARRILAHPAKRAYAKGSSGTTVRAIKIFLKWKGYDPGPINGRWDAQTQRAFTECRKNHGNGETRATPATIKKISTDFGPPGPRPPRIRATQASMSPAVSSHDQGMDFLREALGGGDIPLPVYSGVGEAPGAPSTGQAAALAGMKDRQIGDLRPPPEEEMPLPGSGGFGPGGGATDPYQQGFGEAEPLTPSNEDYIPPMPPGEASAGPPGGPGAEVTGDLDFDPSALQEPPEAAPPAAPPVMPSPAEGGMPFGPGNAAGDPYQQGFGEADPMGAPGGPPPPPPGQDPALLGQPQLPGAEGMPTPPEPTIEGGLTAEDLVPATDDGSGSPMPQALGNQPDMTSTGDLGDLPPAGMVPPTPATKPPDYVNQGNLGDLPPALRAPDQAVRGMSMPPGAGMPGDLAGTLPPDSGDLGDLTGALPGEGPPLPRQRPGERGFTRVIKKGDNLWKIAEEEYGDPRLWPMIAQANPGIKDPNLIYYGKKLVIPAL